MLQYPNLNLLASYEYLKPNIVSAIYDFSKRHPNKLDFIVDSGAYTAYKQGKVIPMGEYCDFLDSLPFKNHKYFMLDVIGNPSATKLAYLEMLKRGYDPIPVVTFNAPISEIDFYYEHTNLISLGGLQFLGLKKRLQALSNFHRAIKGRDYHMLGVTIPKWLKLFKPYSCDSSSYSSGRRFGTMSVYNGRGDFNNYNKWAEITRADKKNIREIGFEPDLLLKTKYWWGKTNIAHDITVKGWVQFSIDIQKALNVKCHLAMVPLDDTLKITAEGGFYDQILADNN